LAEHKALLEKAQIEYKRDLATQKHQAQLAKEERGAVAKREQEDKNTKEEIKAMKEEGKRIAEGRFTPEEIAKQARSELVSQKGKTIQKLEKELEEASRQAYQRRDNASAIQLGEAYALLKKQGKDLDNRYIKNFEQMISKENAKRDQIGKGNDAIGMPPLEEDLPFYPRRFDSDMDSDMGSVMGSDFGSFGRNRLKYD